MGKTRIKTQKIEEVVKEVEKVSEKEQKVKAKGIKRKLTRGRFYIQSTFNNTIVTVTDENGNPITWCSGGSLGFRGPKKATPFVATKVIEAIVERVARTGLREILVFVKGIGAGREAAIRALANSGLEIVEIRDITPIPHNGCKPPKPRRV